MMNSETPGWRTDFDRELTAARLALLLGVLLLVSYPDILAGTHAFFYRDAGQFGFPVASYLRDCFWRGEVPLWNPYNNCGLPFLAQWNTLALYPPSLFYELLPMPWAMNFFILGHVFLAGLGMYFLALRWFGNRFAASFAGLVFAWNGLALNCWMWPCHIAALGWMPWVVLLAERAWHGGKRPLVWAALAGACQMATGSPEIIFFTWVIVLGSFPGRGLAAKRVFWGGAGRLAAVAALVTALSAAQLLPWLDLLAHGDRTSAAGDNTWAMPAWGAANFLVPLFRMSGSVAGVFMQPGQEWTTSYYAGILTLLLALLAAVKIRGPRILCLGPDGCGGRALRDGRFRLCPQISENAFARRGSTRFPIKFVVITIFCLPLLAAAGIVWLQSCPASAGSPQFAFHGRGARRRGGGAGVLHSFCRRLAPSSWGQTAPCACFFWRRDWRSFFISRAFRERRGNWFFPLRFYFWRAWTSAPMCRARTRPSPSSDYAALTPPMTEVPRLGDSRAMPGREVQNAAGRAFQPGLGATLFGPAFHAVQRLQPAG